MSRIGKMPIAVPKDTKFACDLSRVEVTGPKGRLTYDLPQGIKASLDGGKILVNRDNEDKNSKALHGLARSLIANMVTGVTQGFERKLEIVGVGFRADMEKNALKITVGYSHPVFFPIPEGIRVEVEKQTQITIKGIDKQQVGSVAATLRAIKQPEPYKGKGIRYLGEHIRKKVGKTKA